MAGKFVGDCLIGPQFVVVVTYGLGEGVILTGVLVPSLLNVLDCSSPPLSINLIVEDRGDVRFIAGF